MSDSIEVITTTAGDTIEVVTQGPQGAQGATGPTGPAGSTTFGTTAGTSTEGNDGRIAGIFEGSINTYEGSSITTSVGGVNITCDSAGSINTVNGGSISTGLGGNIDTSGGGGSIVTSGTGSIELGVTGTRTTLVGSAATTDKTITLPNSTGTVALTQQATDIEITDPTKGYILNSATKRWRLTIDDNGVLLRTALALIFSLSFMCGSQAQVRDLVYNTNNVVVGPTNTTALSFTNTVLFSNALTLPQAAGLSSATANGIQWRSIYPSSNGLIALSGTSDQGQTTFRISTGTMSGTTEEIALFNASAVTLYKGLAFNNTTNAAVTRTNLGVTVASNLPAPYSGAATTNSLLVANGSGSSVFVSTLPSLTLATGTITNTNPALSISQTWSNTNVAFTGLLVNITNSNSAAASRLFRVQSGGTDRVSILPTGGLDLNPENNTPAINLQENWQTLHIGVGSTNFGSGAVTALRLVGRGSGASKIQVYADQGLELKASSDLAAGATGAYIIADSANTLASRNGTNPQTYNVYGSYTNSTNYRRLSVGMSNSGIAFMRPEQAGPLTNASNFIYISGLPATNTGLPSGVLWNSNGSVVVSP